VASEPPEELWSELVPKAIKIPYSIYKYRRLIARGFKLAQVKMNRGATSVLVTGRPSVGKSTLIQKLQGQSGDLNWGPPPDASVAVESSVIRMGLDWHICRIVPGQDIRERDEALHEALSKHKKLKGIIHVVDWGYTPERRDAVRLQRISEGVDTVAKIRDRNLRQEVTDFEYLCRRAKESISRGNGPKWIMIAVNKIDLFFNDLDDAQRYYSPALVSPFTQPLHDLIRSVGSTNISCYAGAVSAWQEHFAWNKEEVRSQLIAKDARDRLLIFRDALDTVK
jgi:hypothetical protein